MVKSKGIKGLEKKIREDETIATAIIMLQESLIKNRKKIRNYLSLAPFPKILDNPYESPYGYGSISTKGANTMNKAELIEALGNEVGLTRSKAEAAVVKGVVRNLR